MKLWNGRFEKEPSKTFMKMSESISFDYRLWREEILASIVYAMALEDSGIITGRESGEIISGLKKLWKEAESGTVFWEKTDEDIHSAVERSLYEKIGKTAYKLHTGRSRNEQIVTDIKLFLKRNSIEITKQIIKLEKVILEIAEKNLNLLMPGYTHMQHAQPVRVSYHLLAWYFMILRDFERLKDCYKRINLCPLGSGAISGNSFNLDREKIAGRLGFSAASQNAMDSISDRDFILEFLSVLASISIHLSRICEEIVIWSTGEFNFVELDDGYSTGSSLMPQKKNPDSAELIRGKAGRVLGAWLQVASVLKGLGMAYSRDLQEDKELLFDSIETVLENLSVSAGMIESMKFKRESLNKQLEDEFLLATELVDYLVEKGVAFREAHRLVGKVVKLALKGKGKISEIPLKELKKISDKFEIDFTEVLDKEKSVERKKSLGGTSHNRVLEQIDFARKELEDQNNWVKDIEKKFKKVESDLL